MWALNNSNMNYLEEMKKFCPFPTKIYDTMKSSGVYKMPSTTAGFVDGYYKANARRNQRVYGRRLGFKVSINSRVDKPCIFRQTWSLDPQRKSPTTVKKIELLGDLINDLVVHNTDSVMVEVDVQGRTGQDAIDYSWELGERAAKEYSAFLEFEKVYARIRGGQTLGDG